MEKLTYLEPCANLDYFSDMKNKKKWAIMITEVLPQASGTRF